jgi:hypothetical protein
VPVTIESGPARVLASGSATCFMGRDLVLRIAEPVELAVEFTFISRPEVPDVAVDVTTAESLVRFTCVNFDHADGRGSAKPVLLGEAGRRLVFLHFRVFLHGRTEDRTVHYTLYSVEKSEVGWVPTRA